MAVSVDHNSTMSDLRDFIKENKLKITTSGPGRTKDKILAEIKAMTTNKVTDKSSIQELRAYIQIKKLDIKTAGKGRTKAAILQDIRKTIMLPPWTASCSPPCSSSYLNRSMDNESQPELVGVCESQIYCASFTPRPVAYDTQVVDANPIRMRTQF